MLCFRCLVPGCDDERNPHYLAPWVPEAVPPAEQDTELGASTEYKPDQCHMYTPDSNVTDMSCPLGHFSRDTAKCDAWVYEDHERTIVGEVCGPYIATQPIPTYAAQAAILGSLFVAPFDSCAPLARGSEIRVFS